MMAMGRYLLFSGSDQWWLWEDTYYFPAVINDGYGKILIIFRLWSMMAMGRYLLGDFFFMSRLVWPAGHYVSVLSVRPSVRPSRFRGTTLRAAPSKSYAFSTNYHACIEMPTWPRCASPILCWPWPPYNLLPRLCLT